MPGTAQDIETMSCDELLRELARLTSERDVLQAQVGTAKTADPSQGSQVTAMERQAARIQRIGELIAQKGCG